MSPYKEKYIIDDEYKYEKYLEEYLIGILEDKNLHNEDDLSQFLNLSEEQSKILRTWILMIKMNFYNEGYEDGERQFKEKVKKLFDI